VSWYYDAPPYPLDPHENKPIKVYEGESCDVTITNPDGTTTVEHHCRIQLVDNAGVPLPRENFYSLKPASTLANLYPQYAVVIAIVNINGNRPEGGEKATFTVHVSWRPA
jgi:hypothetical protein